ncbi:MAG: hypothetical protein IPK64_04215 [bacterium]|nr:hypothetical protein [bacterium]
MNRLLTILAVLAMAASAAQAAKLPPKEAPAGQAPWTSAKAATLEGFEGAFPPAGWTLSTTDAAHTWLRDTQAPYSGQAAARVTWQAAMAQDEQLSFAWPVGAGEDLYFATQGSVPWSANADFTVEINGVEVYSFQAQNGGTSWLWEYVQVDLAAHEGTTPEFTFRYSGQDGADHYFDAVRIGTYSPPPPPDPVDFCASVFQGTGSHFERSTCDGANIISLLPCGDYAENGLEHYYEIEVPAGCFFTAQVTYDNADGALWLLDGCQAEGGAFGCLDYADATLAGGLETVSYTNSTSSMQVVYLVLDSWGTNACGSYVFDFISDCAVATENENFGSIKAMFR